MRYILQGRAAVSGEDELVDHRGAEGVQPSDRPELGANGRVKPEPTGTLPPAEAPFTIWNGRFWLKSSII